MKYAASCCQGRYEFKDGRGLCSRCRRRAQEPRREDTLRAAMDVAETQAEFNLVGAARLMAWALRREAPFASDLRFEQGPAACAALLRP